MDETRRFERRLSHPPEKVWRALTEEKELTAWFPDDEEREIIACEPPHLLVMRLGEEELRWELRPVETSTVLVLTVRSHAANDVLALAA